MTFPVKAMQLREGRNLQILLMIAAPFGMTYPAYLFQRRQRGRQRKCDRTFTSSVFRAAWGTPNGVIGRNRCACCTLSGPELGTVIPHLLDNGLYVWEMREIVHSWHPLLAHNTVHLLLSLAQGIRMCSEKQNKCLHE
jgi:hypothetical protein